jgi:hypothetical protein
MKKLFYLAPVVLALAFTGCSKDDDDDDNNVITDNTRTFKVVVQNVSTATTLEPGAMPDRTAPLSHGVWAVFTTGSLFAVDQPADEGTARIAEDGMTTVKTNSLNNSSLIYSNGEFVAPGGPDSGAAIFVGESSMFMIKGKPGQKLQIQTMFVQSNDWFYSFNNGGLDLFNGSTPVTGDVTSSLVLYDAGTEADEPLGLGTTQKPDQDPLAINVGPDDPVNMIKVASTKHPGFVIPATNSVIKVTITPQ